MPSSEVAGQVGAESVVWSQGGESVLNPGAAESRWYRLRDGSLARDGGYRIERDGSIVVGDEVYGSLVPAGAEQMHIALVEAAVSGYTPPLGVGGALAVATPWESDVERRETPTYLALPDGRIVLGSLCPPWATTCLPRGEPVARFANGVLDVVAVNGLPNGQHRIDDLVVDREGQCGVGLPTREGQPVDLVVVADFSLKAEGGDNGPSFGALVAYRQTDRAKVCELPEARAVAALLALHAPDLVDGGPSVRSVARSGEPRHAELVLARQFTDVRAPAAAQGLGPQRCIARVFIDPSGIPYDVQVEGCPDVYHEATRDLLSQWRWMPPVDGVEPIRVQTTIAINYR